MVAGWTQTRRRISTATVTLDNVSKVYPNGFQAIQDLSIDIVDGEFLVLVGPSGCGKSTALRMIAGLEEISGGVLRIGDRVVNDVEPKDRDIVMVFQNYALYPHMTVEENIGFALKLAKVSKEEIAQRSLGVTTFYVTHDQVEAMTMGDRVAVIKDGVLQQVDTPQNLYDAPVNVFVAAFIGSPSMNLFAATLSVDGDSAVLTLGSQQLTLSDEVLKSRPALREYAGKSLVVGIRPEDLEDAAEAPHISEGQRLTAPIKLIEALGSELMVHFSIDAPTVDSGDPDALDTQPVEGQANAVGRFSPRSQVKSGDTASVAVSTENLHFFDIETRLAIR